MMPSFQGQWPPATVVPGPAGALRSQQIPSIKYALPCADGSKYLILQELSLTSAFKPTRGSRQGHARPAPHLCQHASE